MSIQRELNPPEERTQAFFSATMPSEVQEIASTCLNKYIFLVIGIVGAANKNVEQKFYRCENKAAKFKVVSRVSAGHPRSAKRSESEKRIKSRPMYF